MDENNLFPYTPYLFKIGEPDKLEMYNPQPIATSVLIYYRSHFLITTKKTLRDGIDNIGICFKPQNIERLSGKIKCHTSEDIDIAMIKLDDSVVEMIKSQYLFLSYENIDFNHEFDDSYPYYTLFGGINHRTKEHRKKKYYYVKFLNHQTSYKAFSKKARKTFNTDQYVLFDRSRVQRDVNTWNRELGVKYLDGIQGGGVWIEDFTPEGNLKPKLVAIMVGDILRQATVVAIKMNVIHDILKDKFQIEIPG